MRVVRCIFDANTKNNVKATAVVVMTVTFQDLFLILIAKSVCYAKEQAHVRDDKMTVIIDGSRWKNKHTICTCKVLGRIFYNVHVLNEAIVGMVEYDNYWYYKKFLKYWELIEE